MKIISKFSDFYDSSQFYCGENIVYERNMNLRTIEKTNFGSEIIKDSEQVNELYKLYKKRISKMGYNSNYNLDYKSNNRLIIEHCLVIIGEKIIPYISLTNENQKNENIKFFNYDDFKNYTDQIENILSFISFAKYEGLFKENYIDFYKDIRNITNEPIISFDGYKDSYDVPSIIRMHTFATLNPNLKKLGLSKIIESNIVIQEIELFINKLNNIEKEIKFENKLKIQNAGFDEFSFKHKKN